MWHGYDGRSIKCVVIVKPIVSTCYLALKGKQNDNIVTAPRDTKGITAVIKICQMNVNYLLELQLQGQNIVSTPCANIPDITSPIKIC